MHRFSLLALVALAALLVGACADDPVEDLGTGGSILGTGGSGGTGGDGGSSATGGSGGDGGTQGTGGSGGDGGTQGTGGSGGEGGSVPSCGDGVANGEEDCDGADLRDQSCSDFDFDGGVLGCRSDCTWDTTDCFHVEICDDGIDNDGDGDVDCDDADCFDDIEACPRCGDGVINGDDTCDGDAIATTCENEGFSHGTIGCTDACEIDLSGCVKFEVCDDGIDNDGDGDTDCEDSDCFDDIEACPRCGDGVINGDDTCDGEQILTTCEEEGFSHGTIGCTDACELDTSGCFEFESCNDGIDNDGDGDTDCDDGDCEGDFNCPVCGDGSIQLGEDCEDGIALTASCGTFGFNSGDLACAGCLYDLTDCHDVEICTNGVDDNGDGLIDCADPECDQVPPCPVCGNGVIEGDEECDDTNTDDGDGCSSNCAIEPWYVAQTVGGTSSRSGSIDTTDPQYIRLVLCGGTSANSPNYYDAYYLENPGPGGVEVRVDAAWSGGDGYLFAYSNFDPANQTVGCIEGNDDYNSTTSASAVHATVPGNGGIYIVATTFSANAAIGAYTLTANTLHVCGDGVVGGNEQCDFGDVNDGDGCSSSCQVEASWDCDDTGCWPIVCGNGILERGEECDDANTMSGDGCDASCLFEGTTCVDAGVINNHYRDPTTGIWTFSSDTTDKGADYSNERCGLTGGEHDMVFLFIAPETGTYEFDMFDQIFDDMLYVWKGSCGNGSPEVACVDGGTTRAWAAAGEFLYIVATGYGSPGDGDHGTFTISIEQVAVCGDGVVGVNEQCDDGDILDGDGCSSTCQFEPNWDCSSSPCTPTVCGNGVVEGNERCDGTPGCTPDCQLPGDTCETAIPIDSTHFNPNTYVWTYQGDTTGYTADYVASCATTGGEPDIVFSFTAPYDGRYTFDVDPVTFDDVFMVWGGGCGLGGGLIACKDTGRDAADLSAGEQVHIAVMGYGSSANGDDGPFTLTIHAATCGNGILDIEEGETCDMGTNTHAECDMTTCQVTPGWACDTSTCWVASCGNGIVEPGEDCDDDNTTPGDGCSATCQWEADTCADAGVIDDTFFSPHLRSWVIRADSTGYAANYTNDRCGLTGAEPDMVFSFEVPVTGTYTFEIDDFSGFDDMLYVWSGACGTGSMEVACIDTDQTADTHLFTGEQLYIVATGYGSSSSNGDWGPFKLIIEQVEACGDGNVGTNEQCDFGDLIDGDGCNADCRIELGWACDETSCWQTVCGDGIVEGAEECDDSNTDVGDGCDADCQWEASTCADAGVIDATYYDAQTRTWTVSGDTTNKGSDYQNTTCGQTGLEPDMVFSFVVPETGTYRFEMYDHPGHFDDMLYVWSGACGAGSDEVACVDTGATDLLAVPGEQLYIVATGYTSTSTPDNHGPFRLDIQQVALCGDGIAGPLERCDHGDLVDGDGCDSRCQMEAGYLCDAMSCWLTVCGNDLLEPGETCDDGNLTDGDGCDATCELESVPQEQEPNDTIATANPLGTFGAITGALSPAKSDDYFSVDLVVGIPYLFETTTALDGSCDTSASHDTELRIFDAAGTQLAFDQDGGVGYCSRLIFWPETTDTYYVHLTTWSGSTSIPIYYLWWGPQ